MLSRVFVVALLIPSLAAAQTQTTDCARDYLGNIHCTTNQQQGINWGLITQYPNAGQSFGNGWNQGQQMRAQIEQQRAAQRRAAAEAAAQEAIQRSADEETQARAAAQAQSDHAGVMIAGGDCVGAQQYALSVGNIVLAKEVKDFCAK
jgi:hypothetical protein